MGQISIQKVDCEICRSYAGQHAIKGLPFRENNLNTGCYALKRMSKPYTVDALQFMYFA